MLLGLILSIVAATAQVASGLSALRARKFPHTWERALLALGAGFILALVFLDLIPESFHLTENESTSALFILLGFSLLHFFEHTVVEHFHFGEETHEHPHVAHTSVFGAVGGLTLHAFFDGMAIASISNAHPEMGVLTCIAVLLHKIPEGLTVASVMTAGNKSTGAAKRATYSLGLATILGAMFVYLFIEINAHIIGVLFALSAGAALYVGASDLIPEINKTKGRRIPLLVFLGMLLFYLGTVIVGAL
ncbi:MAG: ZIP family metal transporter [Bacteroidetes bacterium]|nr:ZIP family metal transporter [Bacteroidota bacterium]